MNSANLRLYRFLPPICLGVAIVSVLAGLWCVREFELNHFLVGYGDPEANRYQVLLWWGINFLTIVIVGCCATASIYSRRAFISVIGGTALAGIPMLLAFWPTGGKFFGKAIYLFEFPAVFAGLATVGVHGGGIAGWRIIAFGLSVSAIFYGTIVYLLFARRMAK